MRWLTASGVTGTGMFRCLLFSRVLWVTVLTSIPYWAVGPFLPRLPFLEGVRVLQTTSNLIGLIAISGAFWDVVKMRRPAREDWLVVAAWLMMSAFAVMGMWLLLYRLASDPSAVTSSPSWMLHTLWFGFVTGWVPIVGSALLVCVPGILRDNPETGERVPPLLLIIAGLVAGAGVFATLLVLATRPDAKALVEAIRPWVL
jgi:hypothetical protein